MYLRDGWRGTGWVMQKFGGIWKPKKKTKILCCTWGMDGGELAGWCRNLAGSENPKKKLRFYSTWGTDGGELAGWCRNLAGSENPKKKLRFYLRDGGELAGWCRKLAGSENPKKKLRFYVLEGRMEGNWLADAENWRDLKTQKKN